MKKVLFFKTKWLAVLLLVAAVGLMWYSPAAAQTAGFMSPEYTYIIDSAAYQPLPSSATTLITNQDDGAYNVTCPFSIRWDNEVIPANFNIMVNTNAYLLIDTSTDFVGWFGDYDWSYTYGNYIKCIRVATGDRWCDGALKYQVQGTAPNRVMVFEWNDLNAFELDSIQNFDHQSTFQVKIYEDPDLNPVHIQIHFGNADGTVGTNVNSRGWASYFVGTDTTSCIAAQPSGSTVTFNKSNSYNSGMPWNNSNWNKYWVNNRTIDFGYNLGQKYDSSTALQSNIDTVNFGTPNVPVLNVRISATGTHEPFQSLNTLTFNTKGAFGKATSAKLYYTSTSGSFATTNLLATIPINGQEDSVITFTGIGQELIEGTNNFWLAYDVHNNIFNETTVDASVVSGQLVRGITTTELNATMTNMDPEGEIVVLPNNVPPLTITVGNITNPSIADTTYVLFRANVVSSVSPAAFTYILQNMILDAAGISPNVDMNRLKVYYTAGVPVFNTNTLVSEMLNPVPNGSGQLIPTITPTNLIEGNNYFWIVCDVDYASICGANMQMQLSSISFNGNPYTEGIDFNSDAYPVAVQWKPIILGTTTNNPICETLADTTFVVNYTGSIVGMQWQVWDVATNAYRNFGDVSMDNTITVPIPEIEAGMKSARLIAYPAAGNCIDTAMIELNFRISTPVSNLVVTFANEEPSLSDAYSMCMDGVVDMKVSYDGNASAFQWEYLDVASNQWYPFLAADQPSAQSETMSFLPSNKFISTSIRVNVYSEATCGTYVTSQAYPIHIFRDNQILQQPPLTVNLCSGSQLYEVVVFEGEPIIDAHWYKDGQMLEWETSGTLDIPNIDRINGGTYQFVVVADGCHGIETIYSEPMYVFIDPEPRIVKQPTEIHADLGKMASMKIEANYAEDTTTQELFQWYRHNATMAVDMPVEESLTYIGTKSNILNIIPLDDDDYTYNGDYYYCTVHGLCGTNQAVSDPIYLFPGVELIITQQPENKELCLGETNITTLICRAYSSGDSSKIFYQWMEGDVELLDTGCFSGVNTAELTITTLDIPFNAFRCKVWYNGNDPYVDFLMSDSATITYVDCADQSNTGIDEELQRSLQVIPNPASSDVTFTFNSHSTGTYIASIVDMSGRVVYSFTGETSLGENGIYVDVSKFLVSGSYMFNLNINGKLSSKSFVIQR
jgi:hypothetical protein